MADRPVTVPVDGRATRWVAHRRDRRADLLARAQEVLPRTGPYVAMDELAAAMGTSKSILYRYFVDRRGIRDALAEAAIERMHRAIVDAELGGERRSPVEVAITALLREVAARPEVYLYVVATPVHPSEPPGGAVVAAPLPTLCPYEWAVVETLDEDGAGPLDPRHAAAVGTLSGVTMHWLGSRGGRSDAEIDALAERVARWLAEGPLGH